LALVAIIGMIAYGSLYPFDFRWVDGGVGPVWTLLDSWNKAPGRGDFISNILLYMPLGFVGAVAIGRRVGLPQLGLAMLIGMALSFAVEVTQYYDGGRDTEATDFYANTLGTAIGGAAAWFFGQDFRLPLLREISANRAPSLLLGAWLGYRLYPYVPTIDLHKYWNALKPVVLYPELSPDTLLRHVAIWLGISMMIEKIVGRARAGVLIVAFAAFVIVSCVLVISTRLSLPQVAGIAVAFAIWRLPPSFALRAMTAAFVMGGYVIAFRLEPFIFSSAPGYYSWMPFLSFMQGSIDVDVRSFFEKFFFYGGLIWLLAEAGLTARLATLLVSAIVLMASFAQVFVPGRSAEVTDAILALVAGEFIRVLGTGGGGVGFAVLFRESRAETLSERLVLAEPIDKRAEAVE
jgi:VanZ family protein